MYYKVLKRTVKDNVSYFKYHGLYEADSEDQARGLATIHGHQHELKDCIFEEVPVSFVLKALHGDKVFKAVHKYICETTHPTPDWS